MKSHSKSVRRQSNIEASAPRRNARSPRRRAATGRMGARLKRGRAAKRERRARRAFTNPQGGVLGLVSRSEVESLARLGP